ncbi:phage distal tail protein [Actinomadura yumaensis]|uniref:Siphovirus-type tail component C-terminal domain-containing protein n=1 Tax=Actinomadura yumaensis TaxID=111807 RepID=A0ABW2CNJ5_9ACTN
MSGIPVASPVYTLGDWQGNVVDEYGCVWVVETEEGWSGGPPVAAVVEDREAGDGAWTAPGSFKARVITLSGQCLAPSQTAMVAAKDRFAAAGDPYDLQDLVVEELHLTRKAAVRLTDRPDPTDKGSRAFTWTMTLTAGDPRRYAVEPTIVTTGLPASTAGRTFPRTYPRSYPQVSGSPGRVTVVQEGTYQMCPAVITIRGPVIAPEVVHVQSGRRLGFGLTIGWDEELIIDLGAGTALLNGSTSRVGDMAPGAAWFLLAPGINSLRFRGRPGTVPAGMEPPPLASMEVVAYSAWV